MIKNVIFSLFTFILGLLLLMQDQAFATTPAVNYDIVYIRAPRFGDNQRTYIPEVDFPTSAEPGSDLVLLHPDGTQEVLVPGGKGAVLNPHVSFDAQWVYYAYMSKATTINYNSGLGDSGSDIFKINLQTRQIVQLTHGESTPNTGTPQIPNHNPPVYNITPCPLPGGKVVFVSNRNLFATPRGGVAFQLFVMNDDGSNVHNIGYMNLSAALSPEVLMDGSIVFSSHENEGVRINQAWSLWDIWPDGRQWRPIFSSFEGNQGASHWETQSSDGSIVWDEYYNLNNGGFGPLFKVPSTVPADTIPFGSPFPALDPRFPAINQTFYQGSFEPYGFTPLTTFVSDQDQVSQLLPGTSQYAGKVTMPAAAPNNDLLVVYSPGPVHMYSFPAINAGIYILPGTQPISNPNQLVLVYSDPNYNALEPHAVVPYQSIYGIPEPATIPTIANDGSLNPALPAGTPFALIGTSTLNRRDTSPINSPTGGIVNPKDPYDGWDWMLENPSTNFVGQGAEDGKYSNSDVFGIRILAEEPRSNSEPAVGVSFSNVASERFRIIGEIPVLKYDGNGNPILDSDGNPDTSFLAKIPADVPFTFQTIDKNAMNLNMAQTWHQLRPGEVRNDCGGCHAHNHLPMAFSTTAAAKPEYQIPDLTSHALLFTQDANGNTNTESKPTSQTVEYYRDIKPILQQSCIQCHNTNTAQTAFLNLNDTSIVGGVENTYNILANDPTGKYGGYTPILPHGYVDSNNLSRYVRFFQSRRSLLVWKVFGQRLDGWHNGTIPEETVQGDASTLVPANAPPNQSDIPYTGTIMPPPGSGVPPLTADQKLTIARWVDLGCPIDIGNTGYGWFLDAIAPTLTMASPQQDNNAGSLTEILIGMYDLESGLDMSSFSVKASFEINGSPANTELAPQFTESGDHIWSLQLNSPITSMTSQTITVQVKDLQGNLTQIQRIFNVGTQPTPLLSIGSFAYTPTASGARVVFLYSVNNNLSGTKHIMWQVDNKTPVEDTAQSGYYSIPNVPLGTHTISGFINDASHDLISGSQASFSLTINPLPSTTPAIFYNGYTTGAASAGADITKAFTIIDPDPNTTETMTATGMPIGATLTNTGGRNWLFNWQTASPADFGTFFITFTAYNGFNSSAPVTIPFTVKPTVPTVNITASAGTGGTVSPGGTVPTPTGINAIFTVIPNTGYNIKQVLVDGNSVMPLASGNTYTFNDVETTHTISASFIGQIETLTASTGPWGTISPSGSVPVNYGSSQTFTLTPHTGYDAHLTVDGVPVTLTGNNYTLSNVTGTHTLVASFSLQTETLTASAGTNGSINPSGSITVNYGASQTFTLTPNTSYNATLTIDGSAVALTNNTYNLTNVTRAHTLLANFTLSPSVPANLMATPVSSTQVNLAWSPSSDVVGVSGYKIYRNGTQIGTSPTASYTDTGLTAVTTYSYQVSSYNAVGYTSSLSASVSATTTPAPINGACGPANGIFTNTPPASGLCSVGTASPGTLSGPTPWAWTCMGNYGGTNASCSASSVPNIPTSVTATAVSDTVINLTWVETTAPAGVSGYKVFRNGTQIGTPTTASYSDTGLTGSTTYLYTISAYNSGGNTSAQSPAIAGTTLAAATNGTCGGANGIAVTSLPVAGLCNTGTASGVTGSGPWSWTCSGSNNGTDAACSAPLGALSPNGSILMAGSGGRLVTTAGTWTFGTTKSSGNYPILLNGVPAAGGYATELYINYQGQIFAEAGGQWYAWNGSGWAMAGSPLAVNGTCGNTPGLCSVGTSSNLNASKGSWAWSCTGSNGGSTTGCSASLNYLSPNGSILLAGTGGALVTSDGVWTISRTSVYAGYALLLNGQFVGQGIELYINLQGKLYSKDKFNSWCLWTGTGFTASSSPLPTPTGLTATAVSPTQINLSWTLPSNSAAVTGYFIYRNGMNVASSTTTSFSDTSLKASSTYSYILMAYDAAGNHADMSVSASATTLDVPDTTPPKVPTGLMGTPVSASQINLTWTTSTDNVAVAGYKIYRDGSQVGTSATASFNDTGLTASTTYSYSVSAYDATGNGSAQSSAVSVTTRATTTAPSVPTNLTATAVSTTQINLAWSASTDVAGVSGYNIYRNSTKVGTTTTTSYNDTGLNASTAYTYSVSAYDAVGNASAQSSSVSATTPAAPVNGVCGPSNGTVTTTPPSGLCSVGSASPSILSGAGPWSWSCQGSNGGTNASCSASSANPTTEIITASAGLWGSISPSGSVSVNYGASQTFTLTPETCYSAQLTVDGIVVTLTNNTFTLTNVTAAHTLAATFPAIPETITATAGSHGTISPSGSVIVNFGKNQTFTLTPDTGFTASLTVDGTAVTLTNNTYTLTNVTAAHTLAASFDLSNTPPSVPTGLIGTPTSDSQINLSWSASTDNVGVTGYKIFRDGNQVGTSATPSYNDTGLDASTTYSYTVSAYDAAGNESAQSSAVSVTTRATPTAPSVPTDLAGTAVSSSEVDLNWTTSIEKGPDILSPTLHRFHSLPGGTATHFFLISYKILRNGTQVGTSKTTSYADTGLAASTTYAYTIIAYDDAGNTSAQSTTVSVTTPAAMPSMGMGNLLPSMKSQAMNVSRAPSVPNNLAATIDAASRVNLTWIPSTQAEGRIIGYSVFRNGVLISTGPSTSYTDPFVDPETPYSYTVSAYDELGHESAQSQVVSVTTP